MPAGPITRWQPRPVALAANIQCLIVSSHGPRWEKAFHDLPGDLTNAYHRPRRRRRAMSNANDDKYYLSGWISGHCAETKFLWSFWERALLLSCLVRRETALGTRYWVSCDAIKATWNGKDYHGHGMDSVWGLSVTCWTKNVCGSVFLKFVSLFILHDNQQ